MNIHKNKITESEVWLRIYTNLLSNGKTNQFDIVADYTDRAAKEFWNRFEEKGK